MTTDDKIDELARMVAVGFSEVRGVMHTEFAEIRGEIADIREVMATKEDLAELQRNVEIIMDTHISLFHKDFDSLATRVKDLEMAQG
jgi:hypothetical protein